MPSRKPSKKPVEGAALTLKQRLFVDAYLGAANGNGKEAARLAGYSGKALSELAYQTLRNPKVNAEIERRLLESAMSASEVIARLSAQAKCSLESCIDFDEQGRPSLNLKKAKEAGQLQLIKSLTPTKYGYRVELHDSQAALSLLGRYHGLFVDRHEHTGEVQHVHDLRTLGAAELAELRRIAARLDAAGSESG